VNHEHALVETDKILRAAGVPYWISFGTLLGFYREGGVIQGDNDLDFCCKTEDLLGKEKMVARGLRKLNFKTKVHSAKKKLRVIGVCGDIEVAVAAFQKKGAYRVRNTWRMPAHFFEYPGKIVCYGREYPCHSPIEEYLEWVYSDWKTPMPKHLGRALYTNLVLRK